MNKYIREPLTWRSIRAACLISHRNISKSGTLCKKKKNAAKIHALPNIYYDAVTIPGEKKDVSIELPKSYSAKFTEAAWYDWWEKEGYFKPSTAKEKFVMLLPPPNVTGKLHIGHALTGAIQDAIVRWNRMRGLSTLWIPGLDHAGIATQVIVEKRLMIEEQLTRHDIGRDAFVRLIWDWRNKRGGEIIEQLKCMGLSLDWSRSVFTMDEKVIEAVKHAFCELHEHGLIIRKHRMINWCCHLRSAIADIEVDTVQIDGPTSFTVPGYNTDIVLGLLTSFAYPIYNSDRDEEIVVATTRLETMLGDTAIAVSPHDERYKHLVGSYAIHPFCDRLLPIVADESVKLDLGSGAVKLTPSHSAVDNEIAANHKLRHINIFNDEGCIINSNEPFNGLKRFDARERVAQLLQKRDLWRGQVPHSMAVPVCSRSGDIIEPMLKDQWFLDMSSMASKAIEAAEKEKLVFIPSYHQKVWNHFLSHTKDTPWCLSRQLWWGHNIPAYRIINLQQNEENGWVVGRSLTEAINKARSQLGHSDFKLEQDEDVLDTWFSSALLPFAALGWPSQTPDLKTFYPGSMIESGSDILFFWIARMVMLGEKLTGKLPFDKILLHPLLLSHGKKMSKSKGNVIDPMSIVNGSTLTELEKSLQESNLDRKEMSDALSQQKEQFAGGIPECGADTLRMTLCSYPIKGEPINIQVSTFLEHRSLCNKIWQIFRFYNQYYRSEDFKLIPMDRLSNLSSLDRWALHRCANIVEICDSSFPSANLHNAVHALNLFWTDDISKIYVECSKETLVCGTEEDRQRTLSVARHMMNTGLLCLAPFMPFLSEELYQRLPHPAGVLPTSICVAQFPCSKTMSEYFDGGIEQHFSNMIRISCNINAFKAQYGLTHQNKRVGKGYIMTSGEMTVPADILQHIKTLSRLECVQVNVVPQRDETLCQLVIDDADYSVYLDLSESLVEKDVLEVEKLSIKLHDLMKAQKILIDQINNIDSNDEKHEDYLIKQRTKIELLKKEVRLAEKCIEYFLQVVRNND